MPRRRTKVQVARDIEKGEKVCIKCGKMLPMTEFQKYSYCPDGRKNVCKDCLSTHGKRRTKQRSSEEIEFDLRTRTKVCRVCHTRKPFEEFNKRGKTYQCKRPNSENLAFECKACHGKRIRIARIKSYGLTVEEFNMMKEDQGGRCLGCGMKGTEAHPLNIDHDHRTGKVRGLLCGHCNRAIGLCMDDPSILRSLADYLEQKAARQFISTI